MKGRAFVSGLGAVLGAPLVAEAQQRGEFFRSVSWSSEGWHHYACGTPASVARDRRDHYCSGCGSCMGGACADAATTRVALYHGVCFRPGACIVLASR